MEARQDFVFNFLNTISREKHKTIYSGFRISGMALSLKVINGVFPVPGNGKSIFLKSATAFFPTRQFQKMTYEIGPYPRR
jgi:hypothetical protein